MWHQLPTMLSSFHAHSSLEVWLVMLGVVYTTPLSHLWCQSAMRSNIGAWRWCNTARGKLIVVVEYDRCFEGGCVLIAQIFIFIVQFQTHKGAKHRSCVDSGDFMSIVQSLEHSLLSLSTIWENYHRRQNHRPFIHKTNTMPSRQDISRARQREAEAIRH
jgi:hypothetical protein